MLKAFSLIAVSAALVVLGLLAARDMDPAPETLRQMFTQRWNLDFETLEKIPKPAAPWGDIRDFRIHAGNPLTQKVLRGAEPPFTTRPEGHFHLDVLVVLWREGKVRGALVQYDFENIKTGNTDLEISRTLILSDGKS